MARDSGLDIDERIAKRIFIFIGIVVLLLVLFGSFYIIQAGERGVLLTFGKPNSIAQTEGLHFKIPLAQTIIKMDIKTQKYVVEKAGAASSDLQTVTTDVTVNYFISPDTVPELYTKVGTNYEDKIIQPAVLEIVKAVTAQYTAEELITKRPEVKEKIDTLLRDRLAQFNINVQTVSITNFDFSESFNNAIEAKVTAEQNALAAKNKLAQVEYEAQQRVAQAEGEARAIQIQADAIRSQGGEAYVQLQSIKQWDGHLPLIMSSNTMPFINMNNLIPSGGSNSNSAFSNYTNSNLTA